MTGLTSHYDEADLAEVLDGASLVAAAILWPLLVYVPIGIIGGAGDAT